LDNIFVCSLEDFDLVDGHKITVRKDTGYVEFHIDHKAVKLNKLIAMRITPAGMIIDHIDGIRHNYLRENLRPATTQDNNRNRRGVIGVSGFIGVTTRPYRNKICYEARVTVNDSIRYLGIYDTPEDAAHVRDIAALFYHGSFARLNYDY
jgi:hypothetical protein